MPTTTVLEISILAITIFEIAVFAIAVLSILEIGVLAVLLIGVLYVVDSRGVVRLLARPLKGVEQCGRHLLQRRLLISHKYRRSCVAFSISKSVEPNEELKVA
jgi:hypothetical protein